MRPFWFSLLILVLVALLAACGTLEAGIERTPTPDHAASATVAALATEAARLPTQVTRPGPSPSATLTVSPGVAGPIACADVAPFAPGCLDQPRPPELAPGVAFTGILPAGPVTAAAWSPDGTRLAYTVVNPDGWSGVEVREAPEFGLLGQWRADFVSDLLWTLDNNALLFVFERGDTTSMGLARLGEEGWRDLLPGEKGRLAVSRGKRFVAWLDESTLSFTVGCGTGCRTLYSLDIVTGGLRPLVNRLDAATAPYADVFATVYLFSPHHHWLAATSWGTGLPKAMVLQWPGPAEPLDLSARLDTQYTNAQAWADSSLAFVAYPPGEPDNWPLPPRPDLYVWDAETGEMRHVASGAFHAVFAPSGDRLAIPFVGEPRVNEQGRLECAGSIPHLGLLDWPEGRLLASHAVSVEEVSNVFDLLRLPVPIWSPHSEVAAFQPADGGLALMNRDGKVWPVVTGQVVNWTGWSASGDLALLVDERLWLVWVP